jgi:hypothetical protein
MIAPYSVKPQGKYFRCCPLLPFKVTICDLKETTLPCLVEKQNPLGTGAGFYESID